MRLSCSHSVFFGLVMLVAVGGLLSFSGVKQGYQAQHAGLLSRLPSSLPGWDIRDLPIATSDSVQKAVGEMLNFDQAVFREYRQEGRVFYVYVAYWRPYTFNSRLIAIHTPDVCWVGGGWLMSNPAYAYSVMLPGELKAWPAQYRLFTKEGEIQHVLYWHIVEGRLSGFAQGPDSRSYQSTVARFWEGIKGQGSGEQFFIRFSSPEPFSRWEKDPGFRQISGFFSPVLAATAGK
jgi:hypothetical protein